MKAITFTIKLLEPLLATGLEGDPNAAVSMNYIAGSLLRGVMIGLYRKSGKTISAIDEEARNLFFNGKVRYLNSYLTIENAGNFVRSLPIPFAWQEKKDENNDSFENLAIKDREEKTAYKDIKFPFWCFADNSKNDVYSLAPKYRLAIHTQRDAKKGRATTDEGAIFRYESISEGTTFSGVIISDDDKYLELIKKLMEEHKKVVFGGSRSAGYGKAEFGNVELKNDWKEFEPIGNNDNTISIYLLSNIILRDKNGNFKTELTAGDFGLENVSKVEQNTFFRTEIVGGFNQKWGLPLPQMLSIKAGSVYTFKFDQEISKNELNELVKVGVGERLTEGFGRIAYNLTNSQSPKIIQFTPNTSQDIAITDSKIRDRIIKGVLHQKLDNQLVIKIDSFNIRGNLKNNQISHLRMFIRELLREEKYALSNLDNFYNNLKGNGRFQFESLRINGKSFILWSQKNHFENSHTLKIGGKELSGDDLSNKYNLLLIDGILAKTAKGAND